MTDIRTEFQLGGQWVNVSDDVRTSTDLTITHGRADYAGESDPCRAALTLNNRHGHYSHDNPLSPWYGLLGRNTPVRISVPQTQTYLALDGTEAATASTPHATAHAITGDIDVRIEATVTDWWTTRVQMLIGKWDSATDQRAWMFQLENGLVRFLFSPNGVNNLSATWEAPALPARAALRVTLDVDNGAGGWTARGYWSETLDGPWTPLGDEGVAAGATGIFAASAPLVIAPTTATITPPWLPMAGQVHRAEVRAGIDGPVAATPDFRALTPGASSFTDGAGLPWTVTAPAAVSNRNYRFYGEIAALPTEWDPSGSDQWVTLTANGPKRRYQQGKQALQSALRRSVVRESHMLAYWPMEEGAAATQGYSPVPGVSPMTVSNVRWAANSTLAASNALPELASADNGADLPTVKARIPAPRSPITGWQARMLYKLDTVNTTFYSLFHVLSTGTAARWVVQLRNDTSRLLVQDADGNTLLDRLITTGAEKYQRWLSVHLMVWQDGANVSCQLGWHDVTGESEGSGIYSFPGTLGRPTLWTSPPSGYAAALDGMAIGHIGVFGSRLIDNVYAGSWAAYTGESAATRMQRLAAEEARPLALDAPLGRSEPVGPQTADTWLSLIETAAAADGGILYEDRGAPTLRYRDRQTMYGQAPVLTLHYTAPGHVMPGIRPVDDDQATRNNVTVTRAGGSSAMSVQETGPLNVQDPGTNADAVGEYDQAVTLSLHEDGQTQPIADWKRAHGTYPGSRFPTVTFNLRRAPELVEPFLRLTPGDRADILNMPIGKGGPEPVRQLVQGWTETLGPYRWEVTLNCTPAMPWSVAQWGDGSDTAGTESRWGTDGSVLATALTASATTATVRTTQGALWTTAPADLPLDITVGGERMTVTTVTGLVQDQFARTIPSGWGTADSGQTWTNSGGTASDYSVQGE
ncbi:hypothetical protein ACIRQP_03385 [Streptomyces sp. NPDC102274]|uniref:hypothetical protein n=1 Tax=Streptomyces sp. NPDC102274 TaxID=3366151 RepID=UPI00382A1841